MDTSHPSGDRGLLEQPDAAGRRRALSPTERLSATRTAASSRADCATNDAAESAKPDRGFRRGDGRMTETASGLWPLKKILLI
jgi:hypothetical protein